MYRWVEYLRPLALLTSLLFSKTLVYLQTKNIDPRTAIYQSKSKVSIGLCPRKGHRVNSPEMIGLEKIRGKSVSPVLISSSHFSPAFRRPSTMASRSSGLRNTLP